MRFVRAWTAQVTLYLEAFNHAQEHLLPLHALMIQTDIRLLLSRSHLQPRPSIRSPRSRAHHETNSRNPS